MYVAVRTLQARCGSVRLANRGHVPVFRLYDCTYEPFGEAFGVCQKDFNGADTPPKGRW